MFDHLIYNLYDCKSVPVNANSQCVELYIILNFLFSNVSVHTFYAVFFGVICIRYLEDILVMKGRKYSLYTFCFAK